MKKNTLTYIFTFLAGCLVASLGYFFYEQEIDLKRNEERYFEQALQLKWHMIAISALRKNEIKKLEKYQIEGAKTLLTVLDHYGQDSTTELYKEKIREIVDDAKKQLDETQSTTPGSGLSSSHF